MLVKSKVNRKAPVFTPPDFKKHVYRDYPLDLLLPYINLQMLFGKHLGLKGNVEQLIEEGDEKALEMKGLFSQFFEKAKKERWLTPHGIYQFFPAQADGDDILIYDPEDPGVILERFSFPRQPEDPYLCLADFVRPVESGEMDYVGFLAVTAGQHIRELSQNGKKKGIISIPISFRPWHWKRRKPSPNNCINRCGTVGDFRIRPK